MCAMTAAWLGAPALSERPRILLCGDSHMSTLLPSLLSLTLRLSFDTLPTPAMMARGFVQNERQRELLLCRISETRPDALLLLFGGVDCEFIGALKHAAGADPIAYARSCAESYVRDFLIAYRHELPPHLFVVAPLPPVVADEAHIPCLVREFRKVMDEKEADGVQRVLEIGVPPLPLAARRMVHAEFVEALVSALPMSVRLIRLGDLVPPGTENPSDHHFVPTPDFSAAARERLQRALLPPVQPLQEPLSGLVQRLQPQLERDGHWALTHRAELFAAEDFGAALVKGWSVFALRNCTPVGDPTQRFDVEEYRAKIPAVYELADAVPQAINVWLSFMGAGALMDTHVGYKGVSEHIVRAHVPLVVPVDGRSGVVVDGVRTPHVAGEGWVFDDTARHAGFNEADEPRVVLVLDLPRPKGWLQRCIDLPDMDAQTMKTLSTARLKWKS